MAQTLSYFQRNKKKWTKAEKLNHIFVRVHGLKLKTEKLKEGLTELEDQLSKATEELKEFYMEELAPKEKLGVCDSRKGSNKKRV